MVFRSARRVPAGSMLYPWAWQELDKQYGIEKILSLQEVLQRASQRADHWDGGAARSVMEVKGHITGLYFLLQLWNSPDVLPKSRQPDCPARRLRGGRRVVADLAAHHAEELRNGHRDGLQPDPGAATPQRPRDGSRERSPDHHDPDSARRQRRYTSAADDQRAA